MAIYQHDNAGAFRFEIRGDLDGPLVRDLECAWRTASSVLREKMLVVEVSGITRIPQTGLELLERMRESGARLNAKAPPESAEIARLLGTKAVRPQDARRPRLGWLRRLLTRLRALSQGQTRASGD